MVSCNKPDLKDFLQLDEIARKIDNLQQVCEVCVRLCNLTHESGFRL